MLRTLCEWNESSAAGAVTCNVALDLVSQGGRRSGAGILHQAFRKIAGTVHNALDTEGVADLVEDEVLLKRAFRRETADAREFGGLEMPEQTEVMVAG